MKDKMTICVPLRYATFAEVVNSAKLAKKSGAAMVEIWLDSLPFSHADSIEDQKLINELFALIDLPIVCVNKSEVERGEFAGSEESRVELLCKAVLAGVDYVDIGLHTAPDLVGKLKNTIEENGGITRLIVSHHDFKKTPPLADLEKIVAQADAMGADIIKIATFANDEKDNDVIFGLLDLISKSGKKGVVLCMGENGKKSRLERCDGGSVWTYAAIDEDSLTAPGQLTLNELNG